MKQMTIWQRLNAGTAAIILLLLIAIYLAFKMQQTNSIADHRADTLRGISARIELDFAQMSSAVRGLLLDEKNITESNTLVVARKDITGAYEAVQADFGNYPSLLNAANNIRNFVERELSSFHDHILDLAGNSQPFAVSTYQKEVPAIYKERDQLLGNFKTQLGNTITAESKGVQNVVTMGMISIVLILVACAIVGRFQSRTVTKPLKQLVETLDRMRGGDFTQRLEINRQDEFGVIGEGLDRLADDLSMLVGRVQRSGIQVNMTSTEIAATAKQQQSTANEIAATTAQIGATSKEISATSKELVRTMNEVSDVAQETAQLANTGQSGIGRMENTMRRIIEASSVITAKLAVMNEKTGNINSVVTTITKVADQTNLLSLNAAIEAEKAGEYGLGFAVVAMEIRRLADQTAVSTYDIEKMVKEMQSAAASGVMGMDKFSEEVRRGVEEIRQVSAQLAAIIHQVQTLTPRFQTVNEGMHTQSTGATQISETLGQLSEAAQQTAESLRQSNLAIEQLNEAARGLQTSIAKFKLES